MIEDCCGRNCEQDGCELRKLKALCERAIISLRLSKYVSDWNLADEIEQEVMK